MPGKADMEDVMSEAASTPVRTERDSPLSKLAACDEDLSYLATDVTELAAQIAQLQADGFELARLLAARDELLERQKAAQSRLEQDRARYQEQAGAASAALQAAEGQLGTSSARITSLEQEQQALRTGIDDRERRLAETDAQLSRAREVLAERELDLERERAATRRAELEIAALRRRSESVSASVEQAVSVAEAPAGHVRLLALADGYRMSVSDDPCPRRGEHVAVDEKPFVVVRTGRSPFPGDQRRCAFLVPQAT
jgi:chromosome segregation ATPase